MSSVASLLRQLTSNEYRHVDRAVAALWWYERTGREPIRTGRELADDLEGAGYPTQNVTRLKEQLSADARVAKRSQGYRLNIQAKEDLDAELEPLTGPQRPAATSSVLPAELFLDTRGYIENVVIQANVAYDQALFDCCAVMLRRLAETLIIEVYEQQDREDELKLGDGNYPFFSGLLKHIEGDPEITLTRSARKGLRDFKRLGDQSAHSRKYNAVQDDIDRVRDGLRLAAEELLHLTDMKS